MTKQLLFLMVLTSTIANASSLVESEIGFDEIVSSFGEGGTSSTKIETSTDPFDQVRIHAGMGLTTSYMRVKPENAAARNGLLSGVEATFGIDLFTPAWQAEGAVRSYNQDLLSPLLSVSLKEFDLKFMHTSSLNSRWKLRLGGGLAARYMTVDSPLTNESKYTTPASILDVGLRTQITPVMALGANLSMRNALIDESIDKSALHGAIRLDAQF